MSDRYNLPMNDTISRCTKDDYDRIVTDHDQFWESDLTFPLHHPILIFEFGHTAFCIRDHHQIIAYLFGFYSQTEPTAYVHLVAVRRNHRRKGLAKKLYDHFINVARSNDCTHLKATASPNNQLSIRFHTALGMHATGQPNADGIPVIKDYLRPNHDRVVFKMRIDEPPKNPKDKP
jgi:GNAT superfamily N-acetyltransferase